MDDNLRLTRVILLAILGYAFMLVFVFSVPAKEKTTIDHSAERPKISVSLKTMGWAANKTESNHSFFKNLSTAKLMAVDIGSKVAFINNDIVAVSHTKEASSQPEASRTLEAFFISTHDGTLVRALKWDTRARRSYLELEESENRLIPLQGGTFLVMVDAEMLLYDSNFRLLKEFHLNSSSSSDLWSIQSVDYGRQIFLRHASAADAKVTYSWLDAESLQILKQMPAQGDFDLRTGVVAGKDFILAPVDFGIQFVGPSTQKILRDKETENSFVYRLVGPTTIAVSGRSGISLIDVDRGPVWAKSVSKPQQFEFGNIYPAMLGGKFGVWVEGDSRESFDGIRVPDSPLFFIFDNNGERYRFAIPTKPINEQWNVGLSGDGQAAAVFDGANLKVYQLNWAGYKN